MTKIDDAGSPVVDVAYKTAAGKTRVMPWNDLDPLAVADGSPYREFPWYLGQRNYSGMYWCATEVKLVGYESLLELSRLLMADFDRSAKRIVSQPFQIKASIDGGRLTRIPDYLVLGEEEPLVIDVTRKARMDDPKSTRGSSASRAASSNPEVGSTNWPTNPQRPSTSTSDSWLGIAVPGCSMIRSSVRFVAPQ